MESFFDTLAEAFEGAITFCELCDSEIETVTNDYCADCVAQLNEEAEQQWDGDMDYAFDM